MNIQDLINAPRIVVRNSRGQLVGGMPSYKVHEPNAKIKSVRQFFGYLMHSSWGKNIQDATMEAYNAQGELLARASVSTTGTHPNGHPKRSVKVSFTKV